MLTIKATLPTKNLPIRQVLAKLFQSFIYSTLDDKEHRGYKHPNGKLFKAMNFKIAYIDNQIIAKFVSIDKNYEKIIAEEILYNKLKLGEIHITQTELSLTQREKRERQTMRVGGFISCAIKDGRSKRKIYLEPKSHKFQEILYNNTIQKYEALFSKPYSGTLTIKLINQKPKERLFHYSRGVIKAWYGIYEIEGNSDILNMILDSGMGGDAMKGLGFVEIVR
jgi:CRISPR-associated endoribonuclease Cas6